jgi:hypothetical protein
MYQQQALPRRYFAKPSLPLVIHGHLERLLFLLSGAQQRISLDQGKEGCFVPQHERKDELLKISKAIQ